MTEGRAWPSVVNLANSIVGVSVLAMPYCFKELGVVLGPLLLMICSYLTRKSCHFLVKAGSVAKRRSYEFLALHAFGPVGKLAVELCTIGLMLATCVGFFVIIGDLAPPIVSKILGIPNVGSLRASILVLTAFGVALPLGLLRKLSSLTSVSSLSFGFYFTLVLFLFLQALPNLFSDKWSQGPHKLYYWRPAGILKCFPIFGLAFACQTQLFPIYDTMSDPSLKRMLTVIDSAINMVATIYLSVGFFGVIAFYDRDVVGDILLSFRPSIVGEAIKLGFVLSVAVSFPLVIFPCRLSINSLLFPLPKKGLNESLGSDGAESAGVGYIPPLRFKGITFGIVLLTLIIGIQVPGIESILGLVGSTVGVIISFIFPPMMFLYVAASYGESSEKLLSKIVLCVGLFIMLSSTYMNLTETKTKPLPVTVTIHPKTVENLPPLLPVVRVPSEIPAVQEARLEPPVPNEPVDVVKKKNVDEKKIVEVKIEEPANEKNAPPDKDDYDILQKKIDAAEEKHDVLLKQLEKQQEQQKIIMEQQSQIIEQLKVNQEPGAVVPAAAGLKTLTASDAPVVIKELEKTKQEIADASKILSNVAEEARIIETDVEQTAKKAAAKKVVGKSETVVAADAALAASVMKKSEEAELSKKVEEAAKYMADEEEKKRKAAAVAAEETKKALEAEAAKKKVEEQESLAKKMEEAARYLAEQEAKKKKADDEAKAAKVIADAKLAAEEAKKKEEEAHKAAELAVQKVLEAKEAAIDAELKMAVLKEVAASSAPDAANKDYVGKPVAAAVAVVETAPEKAIESLKHAPEVVPGQPEVAQPVAGNADDAAAAKKAAAEAQQSTDEKDALKKKLETHEKLIVKMHQKIQDIEKENEAKKEVPQVEEKKENPKPLGLKAAFAGVESIPAAVKPVEGTQIKLPQEAAPV